MPSPAPGPDPAGLGLDDLDPGWADALRGVRPELERLSAELAAASAAGRPWLPRADRVLRAFRRPFEEVRVLLVGQDPYPTPGHAVGLSFSVEPQVRPLPRSLANVFRELVEDTGVPRPTTGDLSPWADRGVLLLNRALTVSEGAAGSHRRLGWEVVTDAAVRALAARERPLVAVLWGREAQSLQPLLAGADVVASAHPSPLSARRGFFGSRPFSRVDELLAARGAPGVDWSLP
ncbi:uracil-DNA glycosylase [Kineococcus glutinatus]|uniref:Uracil-DNA glycosylase n=1 Tax=Kineococcus glutinatus TaxID=1070872 RepID=A0ABP9HDQ2_9ACTN